MDLKKMGKFIYEMRKEQSLTQIQLGEKVGVSGKAVSKWERGVSAPDITILKDLSNILGVSVSELLSGEKNAFSKDEVNDITISSISAYNKLFRKKYTKIIFILTAILFLLITIFSIVYVVFNYNRCFVYELNSDNDQFKIEGLMANNQKESSLLITGIKYTDPYKYSQQELLINRIEIMLIIGEHNIYSEKYDCDSTKLKDELNKKYIFVNESPQMNELLSSKDNLNKISIKISYISNENNQGNFIVPIAMAKRFSNNKIFY